MARRRPSLNGPSLACPLYPSYVLRRFLLTPPPRRPLPILRFAAVWLVAVLASFWLLACFSLVLFRWVNPPTTAVHIQRHLQAWLHHRPYHPRYDFIPLAEISPNLQHAVLAAEDERFYQHHGFDWHAIQLAAEHDVDGGRLRGGSTLTQQLVKNLFLGTSRSLLRKAAEASLVPVAELVLGKRRILELYLNVVEWGPGVYGAQAASRAWFATPAARLSRDQAARLAAILPSPLRRRPQRMDHYSAIILDHMRQLGW
ncbi:MAG TPA: monofunctional biosynthetic peptidoglycan transglycosylase [Terracidiphilus sp.]|nr:monofunctional biosynthetic peptidoglycan transglycosylase [Terracidiphilus sp.]